MGAYEIVGTLAHGGMAELLLARVVEQDGRLVVLKRILPSYAASSRAVSLFLDEARLLARLDHPHIAHLVDFGIVDDHYLLAIEYVHGKDLRSTLRRCAQLDHELPLAFAVQIARDTAAALHHAHERRLDGASLGVVHRDVSPSNIMISYAGAVKLVDFGVAQTRSSASTRTDVIAGTLYYMSPEQASGAPVDRRSDVFSLGVVLWEMITMQRLFGAESDRAVIQQIRQSLPPPPSRFRADCPPELDRIVARALSRSPSQRHQTAAELARDLDCVAWQLAAPHALSVHMRQLFEPEIAEGCDARLDPDLDLVTADELAVDDSVDDETSPYLAWLGVAGDRPELTA